MQATRYATFPVQQPRRFCARPGSVADVGRNLHAGTVLQLAGRMYDHDVALGEALEHLGGEAALPARADRAEPGPPALHHEDAPAIRRPEEGGSRDPEHTGALPENEPGENAVPCPQGAPVGLG